MSRVVLHGGDPGRTFIEGRKDRTVLDVPDPLPPMLRMPRVGRIDYSAATAQIVSVSRDTYYRVRWAGGYVYDEDGNAAYIYEGRG